MNFFKCYWFYVGSIFGLYGEQSKLDSEKKPPSHMEYCINNIVYEDLGRYKCIDVCYTTPFFKTYEYGSPWWLDIQYGLSSGKNLSHLCATISGIVWIKFKELIGREKGSMMLYGGLQYTLLGKNYDGIYVAFMLDMEWPMFGRMRMSISVLLFKFLFSRFVVDIKDNVLKLEHCNKFSFAALD